MVRVLLYHHFGSQDVLGTDDEPVALYCTFDKAFVATASCYIEVFKIGKDGHEKTSKFPTVALAKQIVYDETENLIVTLEEKPSKSGPQGAVRVYSNWEHDLSQPMKPMRARIAGHAASIRHEDQDTTGQFEMIELPLKGEPSCIAVGKSLGGIGVAVDDTMLIYAYAQKRIADSDQTYRDLKAVLEITFNFYLNEIALCEEYVAGCSDDEFQVIKLKVSRNLSDVNLKKREPVCDVYALGCEPSSPTKSVASTTSSSTSLHDGSSLLFGFQNRKTYSSNTSLSSMVSSQSGDTPASNPYIVEDEFHVVWDFDKEAEGETHVSHTSTVPTTLSKPGPPKLMRSSSSQIGKTKTTVSKSEKPPGRTIILKSMETHVQQKKDKMKPTTDKDGELIGPLTDPVECPVSIEYEYAPEIEGGLGFLDGTVYTMVYRKFEEGTRLHSLKMDATYITEICDKTRLTGRMQRNLTDVFLGSPDQNDKKVGVTVFVSTEQGGFMYEIHGRIRLLAHYPYTAPCLQVTGSKFLLYAMTEAGLEIYTTRGVAAALHEILHLDNITNTFPAPELDICLVGLQPFIGANCLDTSFRCLIMLTKHSIPSSRRSDTMLASILELKICKALYWGTTAPADKEVEESNWSLYKLTQPSVEELYNDMIELATRHKESSPPAYLHLLLEVQLLMRAYLWHSGTKDPLIKRLQAQCCAMLAEFYARKSADNWELALPYYTMSKLNVSDVLKQAYKVDDKTKELKLVEYGKGLFHYFDYILFHGEQLLQLSEDEGNVIIQMYSQTEPYKLSAMLLCSRLKCFSNEKAMGYLQAWMNKKKPEFLKAKRNKKLDMLALAVMNLKLCDPEAAQAALSSLKPKDLIACCVEHHEMLHEDFINFSHLAQLLRHCQPKVFLDILVELFDTGVMALDLTTTLLQDGGDPTKIYQNTHIKEYLELLLSEKKREYIFSDVVKQLLEIYMKRLYEWKEPSSPPQTSLTIKDIIPKGDGHFAKRFNWLDVLSPFQGSDNLKKPCQYLLIKRRGSAASKPVSILSADEHRKTPEDTIICGCCSCNEDLIKLQSILCSNMMSKDSIFLQMSKLEDQENVRGWDSLMVLCLSRVNPNSAVDFMIDKYPQVLSQFAAEMFGDDHLLWSHIVDTLSGFIQRSNNTDANSKQTQIYRETYQDVLRESSVLLTPVDFLNLLPQDGNAQFFLPYIEKSYRHFQTLQLKETIISKGEQLAQSV